MTYKEIMKSADNETVKQRVKAIYPHIVVSGDIDKPYYSIHWYDIEKEEMYCGFSSFKLEFVGKWLEEEFEVVEADIDNLINRQKAEIERLTIQQDKVVNDFTEFAQRAYENPFACEHCVHAVENGRACLWKEEHEDEEESCLGRHFEYNGMAGED